MEEKALRVFDTDRRIKLGIWGLGRGANFVKCCNDLNIDVVAGCDFNPHIRESFQKNCPGVFVTADEDEFLARDMDAVLIATWFCKHAEHAVKALRAGKHVMSEVTSFFTPADGVKLVEAVEASGKVYNLLENYPFMKPNMMAKKLWDDGFFGEFTYGEYDYNHDCRSLAYAYIDGTPVQPGWTLHNWRSWINFHYYNTHSLGPVMHITGLRPVRVVAPKTGVLQPGFVLSDAKKSPSVSFVTMSNGGVFRNFMGELSGDTHSRRLWGTKASFDFTGDCVVRLGANGHGRRYSLKQEWPEMGEIADTMGHGGGDFWELYYFAREVLTGEKAYWDVYRACDVTLTGIMAARSQALDGIPVDIPDFRDRAVREKFRNDRSNDVHPDTDTAAFPAGHDHAITGKFTAIMCKLYPWIIDENGGIGLIRNAFDGMKLFPQLADNNARFSVVEDVRTIIARLPEFAETYREALRIADAYPASAAAKVIQGALDSGEREAILNPDETRARLVKWLETRA